MKPAAVLAAAALCLAAPAAIAQTYYSGPYGYGPGYGPGYGSYYVPAYPRYSGQPYAPYAYGPAYRYRAPREEAVCGRSNSKDRRACLSGNISNRQFQAIVGKLNRNTATPLEMRAYYAEALKRGMFKDGRGRRD